MYAFSVLLTLWIGQEKVLPANKKFAVTIPKGALLAGIQTNLGNNWWN